MDGFHSDIREIQANRPIKVTRNELFSVLKENNVSLVSPSRCVEYLNNYLKKKYNIHEMSLRNDVLQKTLIIFVKNLKMRWNASKRIQNKFVTKYGVWLRYEYEIVLEKKRGRPKKMFIESSEKTKSRDIAVSSVIASTSVEKLTFATVKSLRLSGKRKAAELVKQVADAPPQILKRIQTAIKSPKEIKPYTPTESLALMIDMNLTKENYIHMQRSAKERRANIYAPYSLIKQEKMLCYPGDDCITVTETEANIKLQSLVDHTARRLVEAQKQVLERISVKTRKINMIHKWGLDGSGGHSIYNQTFSDANIRHADSNIVFSNLVPIEMSSTATSSQAKQIYWKNQTSSTRYCRPIKFILEKETKENVSKHYNEILGQINDLLPTEVMINGKKILIYHKMMGTMFDGKVLNVLTGTAASQKCYICGALPKDMNDLENISKRPCKEEYYIFGISCLHCYIRSFEFLLHVAYKLPLKTWQARGTEAKRIVKDQKDNICKRFYDEIGLVVDMPKQGGGNSNNGNTARKFFSNSEKVADMTGLNSTLIQRFSVILGTLASGYDIDVPSFKEYCSITAKLYVELYNWYPMSVTVHKLLMHSPKIAENLEFPIGQLSEDVQETRQKDWKNIRLQHTRKTSRKDTNKDILNFLLISSDPLVSSYRKTPRKAAKPFNKEVLTLLKSPSLPQQYYDNADELSSSEKE